MLYVALLATVGVDMGSQPQQGAYVLPPHMCTPEGRVLHLPYGADATPREVLAAAQSWRRQISSACWMRFCWVLPLPLSPALP